MRARSNPLISVVLPALPESVLTAEWATQELQYIPHELIVAPTWVLGAMKATGEYICFLEADCYFGEDYFENLLEHFESQSAFRKLALVAPAIGLNSYTARLYGYLLDPSGLAPVTKPSSVAPYFAQIVYLPGALIRRSALGFLSPGQFPLEDSATACLYFWSHGQRVVIDPDTLYVTTNANLGEGYNFRNPISRAKAEHMLDLFNREEIG